MTYRPTSDFAYVLHVTDGSVRLVDDASASFDLAAGDSLTLTGDATLSSDANGTFVIGSIQDQVTVPPMPSAGGGTLTVAQFDCPEGVDPAQDGSQCTPVEDPWGVTIHPSGHDDTDADLRIPEDGVEENGVWSWTETSEGIWYVNPDAAPEAADGFEVVVTGAELKGENYDATVTNGKETVVNVYLVGERPVVDGSTFEIRYFRCEEGGPGMDSSEGCQPLDMDLSVSLTLLNTETTLTEADAVSTDNSVIRFEGLTPGLYSVFVGTLDQIDAEGVYVHGSDIRQNLDMFLYLVNISEPGSQNFIEVYAVDTIVDSGETGTASVAAATCPDGTDPLADSSTCTPVDLPYNVTLTNTTSGETYSTADLGMTLNDLPVGEYSVEVNVTDGQNVVYAELITVTNGQNSTVTIYLMQPAETAPEENPGTPPA